ncbi:hypothetical protein K435DRAFT_351967 [Dendrothele bispora CBS 962.96]|uniref:Uncharacterized protein n=1 Tax=Dendrothele bispora (strain CBS 962.96) TaxID=1314807 RepID=A0A4S8MIQ0_DENBC|nr:hypothetical protein K435DRAFT_351967 [Dendrothele bispora CBS 962.96]
MSIFDFIAERRQVAPGVVKAGKYLLLTADHPQVGHCLDYVRHNWHLPTDTPESILALAALEVFQHPTHPAHWVFWCNERKSETAKLVEKHANARIPTVYHIMPWSTEERLFMLNLYHGGAWHNLIKDQPWYPKFFHKETSPQKGGPNLRKRRAAVVAVDEPGVLDDEYEGEEDVVPVPKRTRSRQNRDAADTAPTGVPVKRTSGRTVHKTAKAVAATQRAPSPVPSVGSISSSSMSSFEPSKPDSAEVPIVNGTRSTSRLSSETLVDENSPGGTDSTRGTRTRKGKAVEEAVEPEVQVVQPRRKRRRVE